MIPHYVTEVRSDAREAPLRSMGKRSYGIIEPITIEKGCVAGLVAKSV